MKKIIFAILITGLIAAAALLSCSDRGNPVESLPYYPGGVVFNAVNQHFVRHLDYQMFGQNSIYFQIYVPYGYSDTESPQRFYPMLLMLTPFRGDEYFYFNHGLKDLADKMIATGEIKPMIIVCISGATDFGGCFYGDNWAGGKYAETIGNINNPKRWTDSAGTMLDYFIGILRDYEEEGNIHGYRSTRAVSGIGMGGYGAMRVALRYSENFSSVSAVSAPLDFDGAAGTGGFIPLFHDLMTEVGAANYAAMDIDNAKPLQSMFFAAASAFSPHDTGYIETVIADGVINDPATWFNSFALSANASVHLPFGPDGEVSAVPWSLWRENNIPTILADYSGALDSLNIFLMHSNGWDGYSFNEQTKDFRDLLRNTYGKIPGTPSFDTLSYNGLPGYDSDANIYVWDILPHILKYHSDKFVIPQ